jgi:cyclopropane fatty-acyl-phospholipid synthase-like methyltransferase
MESVDPVQLLFGGMEKLGPGGNEHTLHVLNLLPLENPQRVVDAGCGTGRQTLALANELRTAIDAVDNHQPFLDELMLRARDAGLADQVHPHCMSMQDIPQTFQKIDLLWSEGAAYNIGFANALATWRSAMAPGGCVVVSELCWLKDQPPEAAAEFFRVCYPDMRSIDGCIAAAEQAAYRVLTTHTLPREAWIDGYYSVLAERAAALAGHDDASVRGFAMETLKEIEVFEKSEDSYGYVFYVLSVPKG